MRKPPESRYWVDPPPLDYEKFAAECLDLFEKIRLEELRFREVTSARLRGENSQEEFHRHYEYFMILVERAAVSLRQASPIIRKYARTQSPS